MAVWSVRFRTERITAELVNAAREMGRDIDREARQITREVGDKWSNKIRRSGRGGRWNAQMARIESSVTNPKSGALFVRLGWLGGPPEAEDEKTTWFVYQDTGYNAFGRGPFIPGIMAQEDARREMNLRFKEMREDIVRQTEQRIGRI